MKEILLQRCQREARERMKTEGYYSNDALVLEAQINETIANTLKQAAESLTDGVLVGSDGTRNCYFIPMEKIDTLTEAQRLLGELDI